MQQQESCGTQVICLQQTQASQHPHLLLFSLPTPQTAVFLQNFSEPSGQNRRFSVPCFKESLYVANLAFSICADVPAIGRGILNPVAPRLGLGTWKAAKKRTGSAVLAALAVGFRHIDCAPVYGNEPEIGAALAAWSGRREELWISSKLWNDAHRPEDVQPALLRSLADLRQDYLDAFLIHWPIHNRPGVRVARSAADLLPPEALSLTDTWQALEACVDAGLVRCLGVCNCSLPRLAALWEEVRIKPGVLQVECHPFLPQDALLDFCRDRGIRLEAACPLGSGDRPLALKRPGEPVLLSHKTVVSVARKHHASPAQILLAWGLARGTTVLPKSVSPRHLRENLAAQAIRLDAEDRAALAALACGWRYISGGHERMPASPYTQTWLWEQ